MIHHPLLLNVAQTPIHCKKVRWFFSVTCPWLLDRFAYFLMTCSIGNVIIVVFDKSSVLGLRCWIMICSIGNVTSIVCFCCHNWGNLLSRFRRSCKRRVGVNLVTWVLIVSGCFWLVWKNGIMPDWGRIRLQESKLKCAWLVTNQSHPKVTGKSWQGRT